MIHYLTPYDTDKNIGRAINAACDLVPAGDWICLRDGDAMFTTPDYGKLIQEVVSQHGSKFDLFGAMTNRLGWRHHLVPGMFHVWDIRQHVTKGYELAEINGCRVDRTTQRIGGFFMLFSKKTWIRNRFTENPNQARLFDGIFSSGVQRRAIIPGLYLFHQYRILSPSPRNDIKHLI